jgi:YidC/Oxa1 family membrane protein insertase
MDFYSFPPVAVALDGAYSVVTWLAAALTPLTGTASAALAVVLVTSAVRLTLIPVGVSQVRAEFTRRRLAPLLQDLRRRHAKNPELLQRKTMQLYAEEKASPFAGCLPTLLQAPVLSLVYGLFVLPAVNGHVNSLLEAELLGVPLGTSFAALLTGGAVGWQTLVFVALLTGIGVVAWASRRMAVRAQQPADVPEQLRSVTQALSWLPFLTVVFAAVVPLAATLYLAVSTAWTLVERTVLRRVLDPSTGSGQATG